jgi:hypothetical protein
MDRALRRMMLVVSVPKVMSYEYMFLGIKVYYEFVVKVLD